MKLFVIDWTKDDSSPLLEFCRLKGHTITGYELHDGAEAYRKVADRKPDAIIINYAVKPSHGHQAAEAIHGRKSTASVPIYFIDGNEEENEKVEHLGICLSMEELEAVLTE